MDIATAEFFRKEREQCTTRDAKHVMPIKLIPDLEWKFIKNIDVTESDKGVTIYCINEAEDKNEDTQVTEVSEPKSDAKSSENIELDVTEAGEAPRDTQTNEDSNATEIEEPRYKHRESSEIATKDAVPREKSEISEDTAPRYEHREKAEPVTEDAVPREIMKEAENTSISQTILVNTERDTETTVASEHAISKEIEMTDTVDVTEVITGIPSQQWSHLKERKRVHHLDHPRTTVKTPLK